MITADKEFVREARAAWEHDSDSA